MSTKVAENCPMCGHNQMPTDTLVVARGVPMRTWRFHCEDCGWTWANELQREHNDRELNRMLKSIHGEGTYG